MNYDQMELRRRRELERASQRTKKLEEKLAAVRRKQRSAKLALLASTKSETWHRMSLGWLDRQVGYTGEMASARVWIRKLPLEDYVRLLALKANVMPDASNIAVEHACVLANLAEFTAKGDAYLLAQAKQAYAAEAAEFRKWQQSNSEANGWRSKRMTRQQAMLIMRMQTALGIDAPTDLNRGTAHDWIEQHGGNPRLEAPSNKGESE